MRFCLLGAFLLLFGGVSLLLASAQANDINFSYYSGEVKTPVDHSAWALFLNKYTATNADGINLMDYGAVTAEDRAQLEAYIASLEAIDPTRLGGDEAFAYWVNLYNAVTVKVVLDHYPVASIRDIRTGFRAGPWRRKLVKVDGVMLSLDDIEHGILRAYWNEPRVHYAVNCAAMGCPNLARKPYNGASLDSDLDAAARNYINSPRGVVIERGRLTLSAIYRWYRSDFGRSDADILAALRQYAAPELRATLSQYRKIDSYAYDWSLNDAALMAKEYSANTR